jgi:drug/metabolite transporter (DMT)-like permease
VAHVSAPHAQHAGRPAKTPPRPAGHNDTDVILGLALALTCAVATSVAFLLKHRGAVLAPPVRVRHPLRSAAELFRSKWFAVGWLLAVGAWVLHVGALALAPLSIVQAVLSAGLVFLAVFAERYFGFRLGRRQWIGVIITAAGLAVIGLTQETPPGDRPGYALAALIAVECTVFALAIALTRISSRRGIGDAWQGIILGAIAGALFGVSDIALEFLTDAVEDGVLKLISPWTFAALAASVFAFYASARGLQLGPGVEVIALTSVAANLIAIIGGILVFRDSIGAGALEITGRMLAFGLVVAGAALIPAPVRAAAPRDQPDTERSTDAESDLASRGSRI